MCNVTKELILEFKEFRMVDVECACGTHVTIDASKNGVKVPAHCPGCGVIFELVGLQNALIHYVQAYGALIQIPQKITVRVALENQKL